MTCLCKYFSPAKAIAAGLPANYFEGKVCMECARQHDRPRTHLAKCHVAGCGGSMVREGMCLGHYTLWRHTGIELRTA